MGIVETSREEKRRGPVEWILPGKGFDGKSIFQEKNTGDYPVNWYRLFSGPVLSGLSRTAIGRGNLLISLLLRDLHDLTVMAWRMQYNRVCKKKKPDSERIVK